MPLVDSKKITAYKGFDRNLQEAAQSTGDQSASSATGPHSLDATGEVCEHPVDPASGASVL